MGLLENIAKIKSTKDEADALNALLTKELRRNVFRTDDQKLAAFYFSEENENEVEKKGCFGGKDSKIELVAETKPYFDNDKKGCFKKKPEHKITDTEYDNLLEKMVKAQNFKAKALEALLLDESEVNEIEPIHFGYEIFDKTEKSRLGTDNWWRSSKWQETWIFFTKTSLLAYQCEFYSDRNDKKETTYEYQYKDITSVKVAEETDEIINNAGQFFRKSCRFEICVPGDSISCTFSNNEEQINSVKAMKAVIRDKKNN